MSRSDPHAKALGITVNTTTPAYPPRTCSIYIVQPGQQGSSEGASPTKTTGNDDMTWGLEVIPFEQGAGVFEVHQILLPMSGAYILENVNTAELVMDKAWEFMFMLGQNKYQGAVQSMISPVAIR